MKMEEQKIPIEIDNQTAGGVYSMFEKKFGSIKEAPEPPKFKAEFSNN
jgi:hypothetical protein